MERKTTPFRFDNGRGQTLSGLIDAPADAEPLFYGIFAPCFTCTKEAHAAFKICRALAERGAAILRFNMTGLGDSAGDFADTNFSSRILDIIAATKALGDAFAPPRLLIGHSISGTAALHAVHDLPSIEVLATLGSPRDPLYTLEKFERNNQMDIQGDMTILTVVGRPVPVRTSFIDDLKIHDTAAATASWQGKLFVFQPPNDEIVGADNAQVIYDRATCDKELVHLSPACTHLLEKNDDDARFIADTLVNWFKDKA